MVHLLKRLLLRGSANGAGAFASAAGDALFRIDDVLAFAFADRADRAFAFAGAAHDALVADFISHCCILRLLDSSGICIPLADIISSHTIQIKIKLLHFPCSNFCTFPVLRPIVVICAKACYN